MAELLLIEDDQVTAAEVLSDLRERGFTVDWCETGLEGLARARSESWDALVLDRLLPGCDGLDVLRTLRGEGNRVPALVLSALGCVDQRIEGLRAGGDDYLIKPFSFDELAARIEALLRRPSTLPQLWHRIGSIELNLAAGVAKRAGRTLDLLPREFKLLDYLMRRHGQVVTRAMLFQDVWGYRFNPRSNLIDVHIGRLRRKLDGPGEAVTIENVRGIGFRFDATV